MVASNRELPVNLERSRGLFEEAQRYLPGGVNSPVRAFGAVGGTPPFIVRGQGSKIFDVDGNRFIDYVCSWGPLILGHSHPQVVAAIKRAAEKGTSFGAPTELETDLARMIAAAIPSIEMIRFVNSGTEATMTALRLARAFAGRDKIVKFAGGYHGHADGLLVKGGSGLATLGLPSSPGVPASYAQNTLVAPYNNVEAVAQLFRSYPGEIAAVIVEPVAANIGVVPPQPGFLDGLRSLTSDHGALLIFDEVITGFRVAYGGAQTIYGITPDLTCLGKIIGGGLPVGAYGGRREIMEMIAPAGPVYQAGTLSGNPLAMTAGLVTIKILKETEAFAQAAIKARHLTSGIKNIAAAHNIPVQASVKGTMFGFYFLKEAGVTISDYASAKQYADTERFGTFFHAMLERGVYFAPSQFEAGFMSAAHSDADVDKTLQAVDDALKAVVATI